ncbi:MAG TPA: GspH/FimT family pseudopilin [Casimicrobiaceae bacterium]|nr:GspH/FimT family pseudopilin [Casimicrobiaceae bacterium]
MVSRLPGFTLIELLVAVAIFVFLIMLAGPMYGQFMANHQIRNATESILNGVQQAQATAVRNNAITRLLLDPTTGTGGWKVLQTIDGAEQATPVQLYTLSEGAQQAAISALPQGATEITFDGFGRIVANVDTTATLTCIKVAHSVLTSGTRPLNVAISNTGTGIGTKLCDPAVASTEPQACPAGCGS